MSSSPEVLVRARDLARRIRLEVKHVLMRRTADQIDEDHRLLRIANARLRFHGQKIGQRKPERAQSPDLQEIAPRHAVTERTVTVGGGEDLEHGAVPELGI